MSQRDHSHSSSSTPPSLSPSSSSLPSSSSTSTSSSTLFPSHHGRLGAGDQSRAMDPDTSRPPVPTTTDPTTEASATTATSAATVSTAAPATVTTTTDPASKGDAPLAPSITERAITQPAPTAPSSHEETVAQTKGPGENEELHFEAPLLFGQKAVALSLPHHSQDLISLYRLTPTAAKVARIDPVTGEKINKLRSSYQNHIKSFQIAGRNKPIKHEEGQHGMSLRDIAAWPEEEWRNQKKTSKEVSRGLSTTALAKLEKAMKMEPGPVPKNEEWESILGHEKIKPSGTLAMEADDRRAGSDRKAAKANGQMNGNVQGGSEGEAIRARRTGKRRRYDDDSFEGYGEGYVDDDRDDADGLSSDGGTKKKKRRKDLTSVEPSSGLSYGMGVQPSIGRGIGAYGGR